MTLPSPDTQGPIWYSRVPVFTDDETQKTSYLYCKMAHNGRDQWTVATPLGSSQCSKCFCLHDTQRIGCVKAATRRFKRSHWQQQQHGEVVRSLNNRSPAAYVNYEACVRANSGRSFVHSCNRCVCRQDGAVMCTQNVCSPPRGTGKQRAIVQEKEDGRCMRAHSGARSFKIDCNTCWCGESGGVACTFMACVSPIDTPAPFSSLTSPTPPSNPAKPDPWDYGSYENCIRANRGPEFKRACNSCKCVSDGKVACTRMFCPLQSPTPLSSLPGSSPNPRDR
ncbi:hypothetical protein GQ54DRAFT_266856 [Martensiomyces pterosporus]|nr:hypothetical protein GQ54DRAFT_266856 [Martensiomyces pterosporus]